MKLGEECHIFFLVLGKHSSHRQGRQNNYGEHSVTDWEITVSVWGPGCERVAQKKLKKGRH
jgi:hypothetical protein